MARSRRISRPADNQAMPPVAKPTRPLGRHFLRQWRKYRDLSQERAAERIGMDRGNLSKIERGLVPYDEMFLAAAAEAYQCEPQDLIMRNPLDTEAPWSIWETLKPVEKRQAIEVIKALKKASDPKANDEAA
jgi:transcriptional regulator with XRE-family HTH domain